jgi:hypothetical protein
MTIALSTGARDLEKPLLLVENVFQTGTVTASATEIDGAFANCISDGTFDFWVPLLSLDAATATVDAGAPVWCDTIGIAAHSLSLPSVTVAVESSANNIDWTNRLTFTPQDNSTIVGVFPLTLARYWRVRMSGNVAPVGVLRLGRRIIVPSGVSLGHVSINHATRVELLSNDSVDGQFLNTRVIRRSGDTTLDFGLVPQEFIDVDMAQFERLYNDGRTFFYAGSPLNLPMDVGYCKRPMGASEMRPSYDGGELMSLAFEAQVYAG